jgi:hypothetical protein
VEVAQVGVAHADALLDEARLVVVELRLELVEALLRLSVDLLSPGVVARDAAVLA